MSLKLEPKRDDTALLGQDLASILTKKPAQAGDGLGMSFAGGAQQGGATPTKEALVAAVGHYDHGPSKKPAQPFATPKPPPPQSVKSKSAPDDGDWGAKDESAAAPVVEGPSFS